MINFTLWNDHNHLNYMRTRNIKSNIFYSVELIFFVFLLFFLSCWCSCRYFVYKTLAKSRWIMCYMKNTQYCPKIIDRRIKFQPLRRAQITSNISTNDFDKHNYGWIVKICSLPLYMEAGYGHCRVVISRYSYRDNATTRYMYICELYFHWMSV